MGFRMEFAPAASITPTRPSPIEGEGLRKLSFMSLPLDGGGEVGVMPVAPKMLPA